MGESSRAREMLNELTLKDVTLLDPLILDHQLSKIPSINRSGDVAYLLSILRDALPESAAVASMATAESVAAMRDIGMFIGSIRRHGVSPLEEIPQLVPVLDILGKQTNMIPRDTVYHYTMWNPEGSRERLYTGDAMEQALISAVRSCLPNLAKSIEIISRIAGLEPYEKPLADSLKELTPLLGSVDAAMAGVMSDVSPVFFARTLRPYFEDLAIDGTIFMGPAAAHIPISLIDLALWASDCEGSDSYRAFCREVAQHTLPQWRTLYAEWGNGKSIATRISEALSASKGNPEKSLMESAVALSQSLRALARFRGKHLVIARRAYDEDVRIYSLGSGGASINLLEEISSLTRANAASLRQNTGDWEPSMRPDGKKGELN
ncbi:monodechloroaminopyrrolnitrin synthase PrnB family protein [Streptomyces sp. NPDC004787]|uniref:monodechloroaminopyrrolnitrin synthase PrnB family protein n=1 Tax=Streptomyces sp. NPDC004787 TaxID=3154291 RepID=UPI0033BF32E8